MITELNIFYIPKPINYKGKDIWEVHMLSGIGKNYDGKSETFLRKNFSWEAVQINDELSPGPFMYFDRDSNSYLPLIKKTVKQENYDYVIFLWDSLLLGPKLFSTDVQRFLIDFKKKKIEDWLAVYNRDFSDYMEKLNKPFNDTKERVLPDEVLYGPYLRNGESTPSLIIYDLVGRCAQGYVWVRRFGRWVNKGNYFEYASGSGWNAEPEWEFVKKLYRGRAIRKWDKFEKKGLLLPMSEFEKFLLD